MKKALGKFIQLPLRRKFKYVLTWAELVFVRISLVLVGYTALSRFPFKVKGNGSYADPKDTARVVIQAARFVPGALCLAQAITAERILARAGITSVIRVGVKSNDDGELQAHAWLICHGTVILGGSASELEKYNVMTDTNTVVS